MVDTKFNLILDGTADFLGGQDASVIPDRIAENCYAAGVNVSVRRGSIQPRWAFDRTDLEFDEGGVESKYKHVRTYKELFESGKFQMAASYYVGDDKYIIIVIGGLIFAYSVDSSFISYIPISDDTTLNSRASRLNWTSAGKYLVIYDFPANPVIVDGLSARRTSRAAMEVPVSNIGAFNSNRLFIGNIGTEFTGGDPVGSTATPNAPITFAEVMTAASPYFGQIFKLPTVDHNNPITFMGFLQMSDTSTGIGALLIGTSTAIYSYATQNPRDTWEQGQFGSILCYNAGVVGQRAFANANSDAFFLSNDGYLRSLSMSRDEQHRWARIPISREVENWTKYWDEDLKRFAFVSYFKNKIFVSVNPYRMPVIDYESLFPISDYAHGGMVVLEFDSLTSFGQASKPVWAGLWTGVNPMDMVTFDDRAFIISKDESNINRIYEINPDANYDTAGNKIRFVRSRIYTREMDFKDSFLNKEIHSVDFSLESIQGDFSLNVKYKPSHASCFLPWRTFTHLAPWRTCELPEGCFLNGFASHQIRDFTIGAPEEDDCSPITNDYYKVFKKLQLMLTLTGKYWEIGEVRVKAIPRPQTEIQSICDVFPKVSICDCCNDDWKVEPFESCKQLET